MKKYSCSLAFALAVLALWPFTPSARAAEAQSIYVRLDGGLAFYSNLDPITTSLSAGLGVGFRSAGGFGIEGSLKNQFNSTQQSVNLVTSDAKSVLFAVTPNYSVSKGSTTLSFGLGFGGLLITTEQSTSQIPTFDNTVSTSKFALIPGVSCEIELAGSMALTIGIQYAVTMGASPNPSVLLPAVGIEYRL